MTLTWPHVKLFESSSHPDYMRIQFISTFGYFVPSRMALSSNAHSLDARCQHTGARKGTLKVLTRLSFSRLDESHDRRLL
jgi:hypothetical protein